MTGWESGKWPLPPPEEEEARLAHLRSLEVLDSDSEPPFERVVQLVSRTLKTPIALITLVDVSRQWFKACVGLSVSETSRDSRSISSSRRAR